MPYARLWSIIARTLHIGVTGVLLGGHVFQVERERLLPWLWAVMATGVALVIIEAYPGGNWLHEGRGVCTLAKLGLTGVIPWCWDQRVAILAAVVILGAVGSHMPWRYRHFSLLHWRVADERRSG